MNLLTEKGGCSLSQKAGGFSISIGEFEEAKESTVIRALNCFSHKMEFTQKTPTTIQDYPRKGEFWALSYKEKPKEEDTKQKGKKGKGSDEFKKGSGNDSDKHQFLLVVIVSHWRTWRD